MEQEEYDKISKEHDFQWMRDMSIEDYKYLTELGTADKVCEIINRIVCREIVKCSPDEKLDKILKLLNPIVKIDLELRANLKKELSHGKPPRKQPKPDAWLKKQSTACLNCGHGIGNHDVLDNYACHLMDCDCKGFKPEPNTESSENEN